MPRKRERITARGVSRSLRLRDFEKMRAREAGPLVSSSHGLRVRRVDMEYSLGLPAVYSSENMGYMRLQLQCMLPSAQTSWLVLILAAGPLPYSSYISDYHYTVYTYDVPLFLLSYATK